MVNRVRSRLRAVVRADGGIHTWVGRDAERPEGGKNRPSIRAGGGNRWILVTLIEQMNTARTDISDGNESRVENLPLNIEIPLHLVRRRRRVVVYCVALRRQ